MQEGAYVGRRELAHRLTAYEKHCFFLFSACLQQFQRLARNPGFLEKPNILEAGILKGDCSGNAGVLLSMP